MLQPNEIISKKQKPNPNMKQKSNILRFDKNVSFMKLLGTGIMSFDWKSDSPTIVNGCVLAHCVSPRLCVPGRVRLRLSVSAKLSTLGVSESCTCVMYHANAAP
jgi:hypothetical protein